MSRQNYYAYIWYEFYVFKLIYENETHINLNRHRISANVVVNLVINSAVEFDLYVENGTTWK
jgi:hypothetical protein